MSNSYLSYVLYSAFEEILALEDKRCLSFEQINKYRKSIYEGLSEYYADCEICKEELRELIDEYLESNRTMSDETFKEELINIVSFDDSLHISNGMVYLDSNISLDLLTSKKFQTDEFEDKKRQEICIDIMQEHNDPKKLSELGIKDSILMIENLIKFEKMLNELYLSNNEFDKNEFIDSFRLLTWAYKKKIANMDIFKYSKYWAVYDRIAQVESEETVPVISKKALSDPYYIQNINVAFDFENPFVQAIFNGKNVSYDKIETFFELMDLDKEEEYKELLSDYEEDEDEFEYDDFAFVEEMDGDYDDDYDEELYDEGVTYIDNEASYDYAEEEKNFFSPRDDEFEDTRHEFHKDSVFYLRYIALLDEYQKKYGSIDDLINVKNNLLYLLSDNEKGNHTKEGIDLRIKSAFLFDMNDAEELRKYYTMSRVFINDIMENGIDENSIKMILFIDNYYRMSHNTIIKSILDNIKDTAVGSKIYAAVINHEYDISLKKALVGKSKKPMQ